MPRRHIQERLNRQAGSLSFMNNAFICYILNSNMQLFHEGYRLVLLKFLTNFKHWDGVMGNDGEVAVAP